MKNLGANVAIAGCLCGTFTIRTVRIIESKAEITQILSDWPVVAPSTQPPSEQNQSGHPLAGGGQVTPRQQRLEVAQDALSCTGICRSTLTSLPTDIHVGAAAIDATRISADPSVTDVQTMTGSSLVIVANRVSHTPDVDGPNFAMRTARFRSLSTVPSPTRSSTVDTAMAGEDIPLLSPFSDPSSEARRTSILKFVF